MKPFHPQRIPPIWALTRLFLHLPILQIQGTMERNSIIARGHKLIGASDKGEFMIS